MQIFIPKKIRVGFVKRTDTYTGQLAYVIYYDEKNKIRKEKSWDGWRDHSIEHLELDNIPQSGYILNKGVQRDGYWGSGRSVIRIYDPRNFEFEINVDNLMSILMHSDVSKRDINQECVFAWYSGELILLPTNSIDYQKSLVYTAKQDMKISTKDLVKGATYNLKKSNDTLIYLGQFPWYTLERNFEEAYQKSHGKKHVFYSELFNQFVIPGVSTLASCINDEVNVNYSQLVQNFLKTLNAQKIIDVEFSDDFYEIIDENCNIEPCNIEPVLLKYKENIFYCSYSSYSYSDFPYQFTIFDKSRFEKLNFKDEVYFSKNPVEINDFLTKKLCEFFNDSFVYNTYMFNQAKVTKETKALRIERAHSTYYSFKEKDDMVKFLKSIDEIKVCNIKLIFENNETLLWRL